MAKAKQHQIRRKKYNDLTSLKVEIESDGKEKVKHFDGFKIVTDKNTYTLYDSTVYVNGEEVI